MTPIVAASLALQRIKNDLDVQCTCHLSHGPLCPKRIAEGALTSVGLLEAVDDLGFEARALHENAALVDAVAAALGARMHEAWTNWTYATEEVRGTLREEARAALQAVDSFERRKA